MTEPPAAGPPDEEDRRDEIAARLATVRARIAAACQAADRASSEVTLIAVTKTYPVSDIRLLGELGVPDIGENRDQEAAPKAAECAALGLPVIWHFVGQLQTNKAASVVSYAQVIHSVDRLRLVRALGARAVAAGRTVTCLVQVSLDDDPARGGARGPEVATVADAVAGGLVVFCADARSGSAKIIATRANAPNRGLIVRITVDTSAQSIGDVQCLVVEVWKGAHQSPTTV